MIHSRKDLLGLINVLSQAPPSKFQDLLSDLLEKGLLTKDGYRHYNQCEPEDLPRTILVSVLGKEESYCQAFLSLLCTHFPWICGVFQQVSNNKDQTWRNGQPGNMRSQSCTIQLPSLKDHSYLALLQEEHCSAQMAMSSSCGQNGEVTCGTGLDSNHCDLYKEILEDFCELDRTYEPCDVGIEGILKYLQDPRPLNAIELEQYFDDEILLETQEVTVKSTPLKGTASSVCGMHFSDTKVTCQSPVSPSEVNTYSRKRSAIGDCPSASGIPSQDSTSFSDAPRAKCLRGDEESLPPSPEHSNNSADILSPTIYLSDINHLKELKNHVAQIGSDASLNSVKGDESITNSPAVSSAGFQFVPSYAVPQQVVKVPVNGAVHSRASTCFLVLNESLATLEITTPLPTSPLHSPRSSTPESTPKNVPVDPWSALALIVNTDSQTASPEVSPTGPGFSSPQSVNVQSSPESVTNAQPVDSPTSPVSLDSERLDLETESSGEESSGPSSPTIKSYRKTRGVEACTEMVKEYLRDMSQHSYICHEHDEMLLEDIYVDVTMIEVQAENKSAKNASKCLDKECKIYDIAERERVAVNLSNLLNVSGKRPKETKIVSLLGRAGIGKSVLVQKICHDWVNGSFRQFEFVFWFKCRMLNFAKQYTLKDLLFQPFLPTLKNTDEVFQYLCHNSRKVLLILDDFEDLHHHDGLLQSSVCGSAERPHTVKQLLAGLLQRKLLKGCTMLITARPKETFNQYLGRVDKIVEVLGFHPLHVQEFLHRYFEDSSLAAEAMVCLQEQQYLLSICSTPLLCRFICFVLKTKRRTGDGRLVLPSTLTRLFLNIFHILLQGKTQHIMVLHRQNILELSKHAFAGVQCHYSVCEASKAVEMSNFALKHGLLRPFLMNSEGKGQECGKTFSHSCLQNFLAGLYLFFSEDVKCKGLMKLISLEHRKRKSQEDWLDVARRFLVGLAFQEGNEFLHGFSQHPKANVKGKKQKSLQKYLAELDVSALSTSKLVELCHCVYETQSAELTARVAAKLDQRLSFRGTRLTPADIFVLLYMMRSSPNNFAVDLRETNIDLPGIQQFVELRNVTSFRVSVCDVIKLWEHLEQNGFHELLRQSLLKFSVNPFEIKSLKDIDDLDLLVQIHKDRRFLSSTHDTTGSELYELPAVRTLQVLEFALGPVDGPQGFQKLTKILPALAFLKYLDLEGPSSQKVKMSENKIGDEGAERLAKVLSNLTLLEKLTLSRNQIADRGAQELARSLPNLKFLKTLSLYDNIIGDKGAEKLAEILPIMKSLKVLDVKFNKITDTGAQRLTQSLKDCPHIETIWLWSPTITHWMSEHIQQIDVRINLQ
ncbi:MHC class II transactivator [Chiloscyllium punctatum]|uniref:MHC class II transactivator n=1 Tax=Chiloscyllium punctatum TaxID=137246 RepID=UPI003B6418E4